MFRDDIYKVKLRNLCLSGNRALSAQVHEGEHSPMALEMVKSLFKQYSHQIDLAVLDLANVGLLEKCCSYIFANLTDRISLTSLDVSDSKIDYEGCVRLGEALRLEGMPLASLSVSNCHIEEDGAFLVIKVSA